MDSRYTWILDPGHGKFTPGKRDKGFFEWEYNRDIVRRVVEKCPDLNIHVTNPGEIDIPKKLRTAYARQLQKEFGNCVFLSIHANAASKKNREKAHGAVAFHQTKDVKGRNLCQWLLEFFDVFVPVDTSRGIKTANFGVLWGTRGMPSALLETHFFTNPKDREKMDTETGRDATATAIATTLYAAETEGGL